MAFGFQRKSLDDILAGAPGRARRTVPVVLGGGPTPLWAVVGEAAPFGWRVDTPSQLVADATPDGQPREPVGPEVCDKYYPPGSIEHGMCKHTGDNRFFDCMRACVLDHLPEGWDPNDIERADPKYLEWIADHFGCAAKCLHAL
jgi:hypothetical protein